MSRWRPISWVIVAWLALAVVGPVVAFAGSTDTNATAYALGGATWPWTGGLIVLSVVWAKTKPQVCGWCGQAFSGNDGRCPRCGYYPGMPGVGSCPNCKGLVDVRLASCPRCGFQPSTQPNGPSA